MLSSQLRSALWTRPSLRRTHVCARMRAVARGRSVTEPRCGGSFETPSLNNWSLTFCEQRFGAILKMHVSFQQKHDARIFIARDVFSLGKNVSS